MNATVWERCRSAIHLLQLACARNNRRQFRRFNLACCWRIADLLDERSYQYLDAIDGSLNGSRASLYWSYWEALQACQAAEAVVARMRQDFAVEVARAGLQGRVPEFFRESCRHFVQNRERILRAYAAVRAARAVCSAENSHHETSTLCRAAVRYRRVWQPGEPASSLPDVEAETLAQADLVRDLFANPYLPPPVLADESRAWRGGLVVEMARAIAVEQRWQDLPILGDALEESGCDDVQLLAHARRPTHVAGCWLVELLANS